MKDINVTAMETAVEIASREADAKMAQMEAKIGAIRDESEVAGIVKASNAQKSYSEFVKYASLHGLKQRKDYKNEGMTWDEYCDRIIGEPRRSVDRILSEIGPIVDDFSAKLASTLGLPFNKIRMLGKQVGEGFGKLAENELIINDEIIPLTPDNKEEIEAAIDALIESHKTQQQDLKKKLARATKETDKIVEEATKGLTVERDALIKEVTRLKPLDPAERDIAWCEGHLKEMTGLCVKFEKLVRSMVMDQRLHEDIHIQAKCESMINLMTRACRDLQRDWDNEFNPYEDEV